MDKTAQNSNKDSLLSLLWPVNMTGEWSFWPVKSPFWPDKTDNVCWAAVIFSHELSVVEFIVCLFQGYLGWCGANFHLSSSGAIFRNSCQNRQRKKIEWKCLDSHENVQYFSKKIDLENVSLCYGQPKIGGCAPLITISGLRRLRWPASTLGASIHEVVYVACQSRGLVCASQADVQHFFHPCHVQRHCTAYI